MARSDLTVCQKLRHLINRQQTDFIMEAHNGLSARIVAEQGFKGIWGSGLAIAAQAGVRDNNELSWTQVLDSVEMMADASQLPILLDGDTGFGDFNNVRRLVQKLEQVGGAGVCIEDKVFPKTNSFIGGERQPLADIDEFCGKIKAGQDSKNDNNFVIVARCEALITGWGMSEALHRAERYHEAGADAILIHSKQANANEIFEFSKHWQQRSPLVIVPTTYYSTPTEDFRQAGINLVIWANHMLRASITGMTDVAKTIKAQQSLINIEDKIAPVKEVFRLQDADELSKARMNYVKAVQNQGSAIILGASRGDELEHLTLDIPKVMLEIQGKPLLQRITDKLKRQNVHDISVVAGYKADKVTANGVKTLTNDQYAQTGELQSLYCARQSFAEQTLIFYGDLLFRSYMLEDLLRTTAPIVVVVDSTQSQSKRDLAYCSAADDHDFYRKNISLLHISDKDNWQNNIPQGRWTGLMICRGEGGRWVKEALAVLKQQENFASLGMPHLLNYLIEQGKQIKVQYVTGRWLDVNKMTDVKRAQEFTKGEL